MVAVKNLESLDNTDMASITKAYISTTLGQVHYRYALPAASSRQEDTLIFLHKSASSSASYERLISSYAEKGYACYAPDMPGFGGSFDPSASEIEQIEAQGTKWYIYLFMEVFQLLGIESAHVIGHHTGASLAIEIAAMYPDFIKSVAMVGPSIMDSTMREEMKKVFFAPFNEPKPDGSHLLKTWLYLEKMGVGDDLDIHQREAVDHIRAWKGRTQIYGALWKQNQDVYYKVVKCPILAMCAKDDVLFEHFENAKRLRPDVQTAVISGANFSLDRDLSGIESVWTEFI
ncbi:hypothetical protein N7495_002443 [Penicillium taxi]|uniref:uncharacterized protein n=1 Tax=Penicillium taxi TaxID=168475 RepID=UPI0025451492|nr:uncharacterized protein N7495_002443 [Penicillium taxi]KAJ5901915.1 hypothetical protein N7495_002443 [Penicillium taxi]